MTCPLCKGHMAPGKTNLPFNLGQGSIVVLVNVPALVCDQCGDDFVEIEVVRKVEKIIARIERDGISMDMVEYEKAA